MKHFNSHKLLVTVGLLSSMLMLAGCFGGDEEVVDDGEPVVVEQLAFYRIVEANDFTMQVPEDWETITQFPSHYPENTIAAFRNNIKDHDFVANINIVRNEVEEGLSSQDYALEMFETASEQLLNFTQHSQEELKIANGDGSLVTYVYEFEGTNDPTTKVRQFIQLYAVKGGLGYIVTGTYDANDTELAIDQVKQSVVTFGLK